MSWLGNLIKFLRLLPMIIEMAYADSQLARRSRELNAPTVRAEFPRKYISLVIVVAVLAASIAIGVAIPILTYPTIQGGVQMQTVPISDYFFVTLAQFIALLVTGGGLSAFVAYVLAWLPQIPEDKKNIIQIVVVAMLVAGVTALAQFIPQTWMDMKIFDIVLAVASFVVNWALSLFGNAKATVLRAETLGARETIASFVDAAKTTAKIVGLLVLVGMIGYAFIAPTTASADGPADYQYALVQCSGLSLDELGIAEQKYDTWYGWRHQITTPQQWVNSYEARVNEFAAALGCPKVLDGGALTFNAKLYVPTFKWFLDDGAPPQ